MLCHGSRDLLLNVERIVRGPIVVNRPQVITIARIDELHRHPQVIAGTAHGALEDVIGIEFLANSAHIFVLSAECKSGGARDDPQRGYLRKPVG